MHLEEEIQQHRFSSVYHKLAVNLHYTTGWLSRLTASWLEPYDLSLQQYNILRILRGQHPNPSTASLLQERMLDRMSNVSRLVEKLRKKGLVERHTCKADRRAVDVCITDKGLQLLQELDEAEKQWVDAFCTLSEQEAELLNNLLDKMRG